MNQKDKAIKVIEKRINTLQERLESYKKVDASLSDETILSVTGFLILADNELEKGFVKDACDEVDKKIFSIN